MAADQTHFRFGVDELNESTHGWLAAQDTNISIASGVTFLLRFNLRETSGEESIGPPLILQVYYSKNSGAYAVVLNNTSNVKIVATTALTDGGDCTQRLTGGTGVFLSNNDGQCEGGDLFAGNAGFAVDTGGCVEVEFGLQIVAGDVTHGDTFDFKIYNASTPLTAYTSVPRATVNLATEPSWVSLDSKVSGRADGPWFMASR